MFLEIIGIGILLGIAFAAPPGAVTAETFRRGAHGGFPLAFSVQMGSLVGDAMYAILALVGLAAIAEIPALRIALGAFGALFLLYLAWSSFMSARANLSGASRDLTGFDNRDAFATGMLISLTNPWAIAFWLSLGGVLATYGVANTDTGAIAIFFASFMLGSAIWALALAIIVARMRGLMRPIVFQIVSIVCGLALGIFGLIAARQVWFTIFN